jgi:flagellar basal-body rod protein FlgG
MDMSFWTASIGAEAAQNKLNIVSNNLANVNNNGFKTKNPEFAELVNYNLNGPREERTDLQAGAGAIVNQAPTNFSTSSITNTERKMDYALTGDNEFFLVQDQETGEQTLTRTGHFHAGQRADGSYVLMTDSNKIVLNTDRQPVVMDMDKVSDDGEGEPAEGQTIGVYTVPYPSRLLNTGDNEFQVRDGDANNQITAVQNPAIMQGVLEQSNVDVAREMVNTIEAQRAFSYTLRMVTTSDEIAETINSLR